jgi:hypothetical protein
MNAMHLGNWNAFQSLHVLLLTADLNGDDKDRNENGKNQASEMT